MASTSTASTSTPTATSSLPSSHSIKSLCPGYKHVEEFSPDEDYEDEEEVTYVTMDLGPIEPTLIPSSSSYRLIGLDTPTPFLQLSGTILKGRHESLLGTELIFTEAKDTQDRSKRHLNFVSTTEQRIRFREVRLQPKQSGTTTPNGEPMNVDELAQISKSSARENGKGRANADGDALSASHTAEASASSMILDRMTGKEQASAHPKRSGSRKKKASSKVSKRISTSKGKKKGKKKASGDYGEDGDGNVDDRDGSNEDPEAEDA